MRFVDLHTHGFGKYDTRGGAGAVLKFAELQGKAGVSAILPTIYSASIEQMRKAMEAVRRAQEAQTGGGGKGAARILGMHLEGPFLSPLKCGALDKGTFITPSRRALRNLIEGYEDLVKVITIAPELPGATRVIEKCVSMGIRVNMGHSDASWRQALEGKWAGATGVTHLFNAMRPFHHRDPGLAGLGLMDDELYIEVIADGVHLSKDTLRLIFRVKGHDRIILISDSVKGPMKKRGVLQGGNAFLPQAAEMLAGMGIPEEAIKKAASTNPLRYLNLKASVI